jgi:hypothetical protein
MGVAFVNDACSQPVPANFSIMMKNGRLSFAKTPIIDNALYGNFAELNKYEYGKNCANQLDLFSGEHKFRRVDD